MRRRLVPKWITGLVALVLVAIASPALAGERKVLAIGDGAPAFSGLTGTDGKPHALSDYADAKLLVVVFTCNHCPVAQSYEERLLALAHDYRERGVRFVAVSPSDDEADSLEAMKARAKDKAYPFDYLRDPSRQAAQAFGARATPEVFVFDAERKLAYVGGIDDDWQEAKAMRASWLRDALDALLSGDKPASARTKAVGCPIHYDD
jgi:peroxiredoxin